MYGGMQTGLGKPNTMTSSTGEMPSAGSYKHQGFDTGKTASSYSAYGVPQGGYGFIPTGVRHVVDCSIAVVMTPPPWSAAYATSDAPQLHPGT